MRNSGEIPPGAFSATATAAELEEEERRAFFYAFIGAANKVAVADEMALGDPDTLPAAIERLALTASRGLEYIAAAKSLSAVEVLRRATLERLFRVGISCLGRPIGDRGPGIAD